MPISRVRSSTAVYMDWKITRKPTMKAMAMTTRRAMLKPGRRSGVIWESISSTVWTWYSLRPRCVVDLIADQILVRGVIGLEVEERRIVLRAIEGAEGMDGNEFAAALAVLDDAADTEGVIEDLHGVADVVALVAAGGVVVNDDVVRPLEGRAVQELERAQGVVAFEVDAQNAFDRPGGVEL